MVAGGLSIVLADGRQPFKKYDLSCLILQQICLGLSTILVEFDGFFCYTNHMKIHEKIKMLRQQKGWSQTQLANKLNVHSQHISRYERGNSNPSAETLTKFAEIFGVSVDYLLNDDAENVSTYQIKDKQLQRYFEEVDKLNEEDKNLIKGVIESVLVRNKVKDLASDKKF